MSLSPNKSRDRCNGAIKTRASPIPPKNTRISKSAGVQDPPARPIPRHPRQLGGVSLGQKNESVIANG